MGARLYGLDALRGVAALIVVLFHTAETRPYFAMGNLAVDVFFVLSGFVMARTYEARLASGMTTRDFMKRRLKRLWPIVAVGAIIGLMHELTYQPAPVAILKFYLGLAFLPFVDRDFFFIFAPLWSLSLELVANLVHGVVLWRIPTRWLVLVAASAGICLGVYLWGHGIVPAAIRPDLVIPALARCLFAYVVGIIIYRKNLRFELPSVVTISAFVGIILAGSPTAAFSMLFVYLVAPLLVMTASEHAPKSLVWLGTISYPLYAVHHPILLMTGTTLTFLPFIILAAWIATMATQRRKSADEDRRPFEAGNVVREVQPHTVAVPLDEGRIDGV